MGQYFRVVNIDKGEHESFLLSKLGEFFFGNEPDRILYHLLPLIVTFKPYDEDDATQASMMANCLPKIPAETVSGIFEEIDDIGDCFCLALTSKRCWLIGQPRMKTLIINQATQWAGDRIICIGDYLRRRDLPKNLLSGEEQEMLNKYHENPKGYFDYRLWKYCSIKAAKYVYKPFDLLCQLSRCERLPRRYQDMLLKYISIRYREPEILRNISKHQYVRRSALLGMIETCPKHWNWARVDLGHVILSRICWSSDPSVSMSYKGNIHRGVWAGDRFDITSADLLDEKYENGHSAEWKDVTDEVLKEMYAIWLSEYGGGRY